MASVCIEEARKPLKVNDVIEECFHRLMLTIYLFIIFKSSINDQI